MCKQDEDEDGGFTLASAAATCLAQIALTVHDDVVGHVIPFIQANIDSADWHRTEAATLAWGSVLEGPSDEALQPFMVPALEKMISLVGTPTTALPVRDTAAWTIARICKYHKSSIQPQHWHVMLREGSVDPSGALIEPEGVLLMALKDHTRVAEKVCTALHALAEQVKDERNNPSNRLSGLFVTLSKALLACTERPDVRENNLRESAYEALNMVITNAAKDTHVSVGQLLPLVTSRLEGTFAMPIVSSDDMEAQTELQGLLCATLQVITQKLGPQAAPHADQMMNLCLQVFASRNSSVHEEALLAVGSVATATGRSSWPTRPEVLHKLPSRRSTSRLRL
jgi:importin subunit beta-1